MKLGFIGTGAITEAIVTGLVAADPGNLTIMVSPRNERVAGRLADRLSSHVTVAAGNQEVLDSADIVVIAVRRQVVGSVLRSLEFRPDHLVVSLVSEVSIDDITPMVAPAERVVRAIPLPSAAERASPTPIMPPDPDVKRLFDRIGVAFETSDAAAFNAMSAVTGVIAGHLAAAEMVAQWLTTKGVEVQQAEAYVRQILLGVAATVARASGSTFAALAKEHTTEGGLNEQFLAHLTACDLRTIVWSGLDALNERTTQANRTGR